MSERPPYYVTQEPDTAWDEAAAARFDGLPAQAYEVVDTSHLDVAGRVVRPSRFVAIGYEDGPYPSPEQVVHSSLQIVLDAMARLESYNRADSVIANAARDALDDIGTLLDSWGHLPGVGYCYKTNIAPAELEALERLRQLLGREVSEQ